MVDSVPRPLKTSSEQIGSRSPLALSWLTLALAVVSAVLLLRFKTNSAWLVLGGGAIGLIAVWLR